MAIDHRLAQIETLIEELRTLPPSWKSSESVQWRPVADAIVKSVLGADNPLVARFSQIGFRPNVGVSDQYEQARIDKVAFDRGKDEAIGVLKAAIFELNNVVGREPTDRTEIDPELWSHVQHLAESGRWIEMATQTAIFFEDRLRDWAGLPADLIGRDLILAVLKPDTGKLTLGLTDSESQGWQQLGLGFVQAVRNVDVHRIQDRPDAQRYAFGVVGTASLIMTQLRHQHGNNFRAR